MPCFAMLSSCSMLIACSEHCYLMLFQPCSVFSPSLWSWCFLHFCHACLNLLLCDLAVAQCSSFVKHHEWISAMYFVVMLECCSMLFLMHLEGYLLLIADRCYICFACHFQTVHPIAVIFISISNEITSPFQWHSWISMLRPGSIYFFANHAYASHIASRISYHVCIMLLEHCTWLIVFILPWIKLLQQGPTLVLPFAI